MSFTPDSSEVVVSYGGRIWRVPVAPGAEPIPLHKHLAIGTLHAIYRRTARFVPSVDLRRAFFTD